jgi:hypothetical protein
MSKFDSFNFNQTLPIINEETEFFPLLTQQDEDEMRNAEIPDQLPILPLRNEDQGHRDETTARACASRHRYGHFRVFLHFGAKCCGVKRGNLYPELLSKEHMQRARRVF